MLFFRVKYIRGRGESAAIVSNFLFFILYHIAKSSFTLVVVAVVVLS